MSWVLQILFLKISKLMQLPFPKSYVQQLIILVQDKIFGSCKKELPFELTYSSTADTGGQ
jgi:hypothetical protein